MKDDIWMDSDLETDDIDTENDTYSFSGEVVSVDDVSEPDVNEEQINTSLNEENEDIKIEIPKVFKPCTNKDEIPEKDLYLTTAAVTKLLGISHRNVILRYTSAFYDLLAVRKNPVNAHYYYTEEAVKQLAFIINDVRNSGRSFKLEKEFLESSEGAKVLSVASDNVAVFEKMFNQMQSNIIAANNEQFKELRSLLSETIGPRLEDKSLIQLEERMERQEELLQGVIAQKDEEIRLLREQLERKKKPFWKR